MKYIDQVVFVGFDVLNLVCRGHLVVLVVHCIDLVVFLVCLMFQ